MNIRYLLFAVVIANPELSPGREERAGIAKMMQSSARTITRLIDEMLELSLNEAAVNVTLEPDVDICDLLSDVLQEHQGIVSTGVKLVVAIEDTGCGIPAEDTL